MNGRLLVALAAAVLVLVGIKCSGPHLFAVLLLGVPTALCVVGLERPKPAGGRS